MTTEYDETLKHADRRFFQTAYNQGYTQYSDFSGAWLSTRDTAFLAERIVGAVVYSPDGKVTVSYSFQGVSNKKGHQKVPSSSRLEKHMTRREWQSFQNTYRLAVKSRGNLSKLLETAVEAQPTAPADSRGYLSRLMDRLGVKEN